MISFINGSAYVVYFIFKVYIKNYLTYFSNKKNTGLINLY